MAFIDDSTTHHVVLPSGASHEVYPQEVQYFNERVQKYMTDNHFTNISDLQDLDRIVIMETLCWRLMNWASRQRDFWDEPVDETAIQRQVKEISTELRNIKNSLGLDKVSRDKQRNEDSVSAYLENLKFRAKEFGVVREKQLTEALILLNELKAKITLHDNCTPDERKETKSEIEDILKWLREEAFPKYDEIDAYFRENSQKMWVRKL